MDTDPSRWTTAHSHSQVVVAVGGIMEISMCVPSNPDLLFVILYTVRDFYCSGNSISASGSGLVANYLAMVR